MATPPLGKYLASTDKKIRDKAIENLSIFLSDPSRHAIPKPEMDKLWKGIFYCFWMSDKPLVQQALAGELAELLLAITTTPSSLAFLRGFWETTVREWNGIDRLRIDKYYMLVRRFVNATFRLLLREEWDNQACEDYNDILTREGGPLCPADIRIPTSLAYHLSDIYIEELDKAIANPPSPSPTALPTPAPVPLSTLLTPFFSLAAHTPNNTTYQRIQSSLFQPLFSALSSENLAPSEKRTKLGNSPAIAEYSNLVNNACLEDPKGPKTVPSVLRRQLLRKLFEVASASETRDSNRRKMYALWKNGAEGDDDEK